MFLTVPEFSGKGGDDLVVLYTHLEYAFKKIAALVASPVNSRLGKGSAGHEDVGSGRDKPKPLDIVSVSKQCLYLLLFINRIGLGYFITFSLTGSGDYVGLRLGMTCLTCFFVMFIEVMFYVTDYKGG